MNWEVGTAIDSLLTLCIKHIANEKTYYGAQGALLNALWLPKGEGNPKTRGYMYMYSWFTAVEQKLTCYKATMWSWSSNTLTTWCKDSLGKTLMLGKTEGKRRRRWLRMSWLGSIHWLNGHEFEQTLGDSEGHESLVCWSPWGHRVLHDLVTDQQQQVLAVV